MRAIAFGNDADHAGKAASAGFGELARGPGK
jgi:hypothetical protein